MRKGFWVLLLAACLMCSTVNAGAETYLFPYEGLRFEAQDSLRLLTQYNLEEQEDFLLGLGTSPAQQLEAMRAGSIVWIAYATGSEPVTLSAHQQQDAQGALTGDAQRDAFLEAYTQMSRYRDVAWSEAFPSWLRYTCSGMVGEQPTYTLCYVSRQHGRLYQLFLTKETPLESDDDILMERVLERLSFLPEVAEGEAQASLPTATPVPTRQPQPEVAEYSVIQEDIPLEITAFPSALTTPELVVTGTTVSRARVRLLEEKEELLRVTADVEGNFSFSLAITEEGRHSLRVSSESREKFAEYLFTLQFTPSTLPLTITEPLEPVERTAFELLGQTAPGASVRLSGDASASLEAGRDGSFRFRLTAEKQGTQSYTIKVSKQGYLDAEAQHTVERRWTQREALADFRFSLVEIDYDKLCADPAAYVEKHILYRGRVRQIEEQNGMPCLLLMTENSGSRTWVDPVWVVCEEILPVTLDALLTAYVTPTGETRAYTDPDGNQERQLPVCKLHFWAL